MGDAEYLTLFKFVFGPILREFAPHLLIVSAGFDCGAGDLLGFVTIYLVLLLIGLIIIKADARVYPCFCAYAPHYVARGGAEG